MMSLGLRNKNKSPWTSCMWLIATGPDQWRAKWPGTSRETIFNRFHNDHRNQLSQIHTWSKFICPLTTFAQWFLHSNIKFSPSVVALYILRSTQHCEMGSINHTSANILTIQVNAGKMSKHLTEKLMSEQQLCVQSSRKDLIDCLYNAGSTDSVTL